MSKKELKTLDIDELEADYNKNFVGEEDEEVIEGVNVSDLDLPQKVVIKPKSKVSKVLNKFDAQAHAQRKKLNSLKGEKLVKHMTNKYRFDRSKPVYWAWVLMLVIALMGFTGKEIPKHTVSGENYSYIIQLGAGIFNLGVSIFNKAYLFIIAAILFFVPLRRTTPTMVEVFYDGLTVPHEVLPIGAYMRRRIIWRQIKSIGFKTKRQVPIMQLFAKDQSLLGEIRLDVDDVGTMYECIDLYAPKEHPIRILFENKKS